MVLCAEKRKADPQGGGHWPDLFCPSWTPTDIERLSIEGQSSTAHVALRPPGLEAKGNGIRAVSSVVKYTVPGDCISHIHMHFLITNIVDPFNKAEMSTYIETP